MSNGTDRPWWLATLLQYRIGILISVLAVVIVVQTFILVGRVRIIGGDVYYGAAELGAHVTVDATAGFQDSGIRLDKGDVIQLRPQGRVHVALEHATNLANNAKSIIVHSNVTDFHEDIMDFYPKPRYDDDVIFYRHWIGPSGENTSSDILEEAKLKIASPWGALLAAVVDRPISPSADPFEILEANGLKPYDLIDIPGPVDFEAHRSGVLAFIINEAVLSPRSPSEDSRQYLRHTQTGGADVAQQT